MSATELRHDALSGRTAIVAAGRAARPHTVGRSLEDADTGSERCPFCPGHEHETPPEVLRAGPGAPDTPGWRVRVFPNLYPIVASDGDGSPTGAHEVVVLSPDHTRSFGRLDDAAAIEVVSILRDRVRAHLDRGLSYAVAIVNHRRAAGASIAHPHAQVIALGVVPPEVLAADARAADAATELLSADLDVARTHNTVLTDSNATVASWLPHAGTSSFLGRVAHAEASARFDVATDDMVAGVALAVRDFAARLDHLLDDPPYNITVHGAAADGTGPRRWYVEIAPRLAVIAGFELATGIFVNTMPPERAAELLGEQTP
jgi:UDPglucose--hexose-1-phosphate uridylyltransferase